MENKTAIISGGLGDIGSAIAIYLGKSGLNIALGDLADESTAQPVMDRLREAGCKKMMYTTVDVTIPEAVESWLQATEEQWGTAQVVISNAGIVVGGKLTDIHHTEVKRQVDVNFWGSYYTAVMAAARMQKAALPGRIVFIGSWAAERPNARIPAYCISKAALRMLSKTLALELAEHQILVNEVAPGIVDGGLSRKNQQADPTLLERQLEAIPLHTLITAEEVAAYVGMLCSFDQQNITGSTILLDGGLSLTSKMSR